MSMRRPVSPRVRPTLLVVGLAGLFPFVETAHAESGLLLPLAGQVRLAGRTAAPGSFVVIPFGDQVEIEPGGRVWLFCPDASCRELTGSFRMDNGLCNEPHPACLRRKELSARLVDNEAGSSAKKLVIAGHEWSLGGGGTLLGLARAEDPWSSEPVLISPRADSSEGVARPWRKWPQEVVFAAMSGAHAYRIELLTAQGARIGDDPITVLPHALDCSPWPDLDNRQICRIPWPESFRPPTEKPITLKVRAYLDGDRIASSRATIELASSAATGPASSPAPAPAAFLLAESLDLIEGGYFSELAELLRQESHLPPQLELAQAHAYLQLSLLPAAAFHYRAVLSAANPCDLLAAQAKLGLGRCELAKGQKEAAKRPLAEALDTFETLNLVEEARETADLLQRAEGSALPRL